MGQQGTAHHQGFRREDPGADQGPHRGLDTKGTPGHRPGSGGGSRCCPRAGRRSPVARRQTRGIRMNLNQGELRGTFADELEGSKRSPACARAGMRRLGALYSFLALIFGFSGAFAQQRDGNLYWVPPNYTAGGEKIDSILIFIFWLTLFVFIAVQGVLIVYLFRYRRRKGRPAYYSHGNNFLEVIWTSIPVLIFLGLAIY